VCTSAGHVIVILTNEFARPSLSVCLNVLLTLSIGLRQRLNYYYPTPMVRCVGMGFSDVCDLVCVCAVRVCDSTEAGTDEPMEAASRAKKMRSEG